MEGTTLHPGFRDSCKTHHVLPFNRGASEWGIGTFRAFHVFHVPHCRRRASAQPAAVRVFACTATALGLAQEIASCSRGRLQARPPRRFCPEGSPGLSQGPDRGHCGPGPFNKFTPAANSRPSRDSSAGSRLRWVPRMRGAWCGSGSGRVPSARPTSFLCRRGVSDD